MDITLLSALAAIIIILILRLNLYLKQCISEKGNGKRRRPVPVRQTDVAIPRRAQLARIRSARLRTKAQAVVVQNNEENEDYQLKRFIEVLDAKLGAKKRAKLEAKTAKKAQREAEVQIRAERQEKYQLAEEERRKFEEKEEAEAKLKEELLRNAREEKERQEYEEYLKMKVAFTVEEDGFEDDDQDNEQNLLQEFVSFVKNNKVVVIEDLAAKFKLKTQTAIDRIKALQVDNVLTGVIDDGGRFIYVSEEEMKAVAKFITQRGRVSVAELAENSNKLINLTPAAVNCHR